MLFLAALEPLHIITKLNKLTHIFLFINSEICPSLLKVLRLVLNVKKHQGIKNLKKKNLPK